MISFVCGQLCSGKTLYSKALAHICDGIYIEVGDIVREIKQTQDRKVLQHSSELYVEIISKLKKQAELFSGRDLIVSGVRQQEILAAFPESTLLWVECPKEERRTRYSRRARNGDTQTFEEAENGDIDLGILTVKNYIFSQNQNVA